MLSVFLRPEILRNFLRRKILIYFLQLKMLSGVDISVEPLSNTFTTQQNSVKGKISELMCENECFTVDKCNYQNFGFSTNIPNQDQKDSQFLFG